MEEKMKGLIIEGTRCIGGTKLFLQENGTGILLDFGINYSKWNRYFEEFLNPRSARGLVDYWTLDLIPKFDGLYREDCIPKDFRPEWEKRLDVEGLFLSHAHLDHAGLIGLLRRDISIYSSPETAAILKGYQVSGSAKGIHSELVYFPEKTQGCKVDERALVSNHEDYLGRRFVSVFPVTDELREFWDSPPNPSGKGTKKLCSCPMEVCNDSIGAMPFRSFPVDHSIPGAVAFAFETERGLIVYTGDLRMHGRYANETRKFVEEIAQQKPYLLIIEGTRLGRKKEQDLSEEEVYERCHEIVEKSKGRLVIADFAGRHFERLDSFLRIAEETRRKLVVPIKDGFMLQVLHAANPRYDAICKSNLVFYDKVRAKTDGWETHFREKQQAHLVESGEIQRNPEDYILAFSFWDMNEMSDIKPYGGVYIYSSSEAFSEDQKIDFWRLHNWIEFFGMELRGFRWDPEKREPSFSDDPLSASGHIKEEDLLWMIKEIQPRNLLPVHTEKPEWFAESFAGEPIEVWLLNDGHGFG